MHILYLFFLIYSDKLHNILVITNKRYNNINKFNLAAKFNIANNFVYETNFFFLNNMMMHLCAIFQIIMFVIRIRWMRKKLSQNSKTSKY